MPRCSCSDARAKPFENPVVMFTKFWNSCFPEFSSQQVYRHNFYLCQWQLDQEVGILYLIYRWLSAILFLAVLSCSLLDIGRTDEPRYEHHHAKWWIYLTHWGLMACAVQAWLGAWIVTQGMMVDRDDYGMQRQVKKSIFHQAYWILYTIATVYSFIITICYWTVVHNPEINKVDAVNVMVHVFNSLIMLIDLTIVGHPIQLSHAYFTMGIGLAYSIFTAIYFLAGGTTRKNTSCIYPLLDWSKPGKSIVVSAAGILFVFIIHFMVYCMYRLRVCIFTNACLGIHEDKEKMSLSRTVSSLENAQKEQFLNPNTIVELRI